VTLTTTTPEPEPEPEPEPQQEEQPRRFGSRRALITPQSLPTSIEGLQTLLTQLQQQLANLLANTPASNNNPITRDIQLNDQGEDVRTLQQLLISKGYAIPAGVTGFFGTQTQQALIKFQQDNNITPAQGYYGPVTSARLNQ
jgi:peptidoglycan hydrolase-like protein with peptidoglycan-binding domain